MVLYIGCAIGHMTIFKLNLKRGHKFILSALLFGYCMCRITSMIMRIVWACYPTDIRLELAASVFIAAGVLILYLVNLLFAQRIIRATHPHLGWSKVFSACFIALYILVPCVLAMIITVSIQSYYTLDPKIVAVDNKVRLVAIGYLMSLSFLPLPLMALNFLLPLPKAREIEQFGVGGLRLKVAALITSTVLLVLGTGFRFGIALLPPRPSSDPAWYDRKACFWVFDIVVEILVAYLYLILRVDRRFHVADGADGPGGYSVESIIYLREHPDYNTDGKERLSDCNTLSISDQRRSGTAVEIPDYIAGCVPYQSSNTRTMQALVDAALYDEKSDIETDTKAPEETANFLSYGSGQSSNLINAVDTPPSQPSSGLELGNGKYQAGAVRLSIPPPSRLPHTVVTPDRIDATSAGITKRKASDN